ncbi:helix-turn-helix domain-containing protein [Mycobacterium sp. CnD-18-1]|uniref:helix-turn-helix domain-containing protein n=1 Tax=Mycobacterium sp. CnD-18-1 TaxID=2917744 RepID=UPI001EF27378|nr:helix-turn-helix domain-containing protein [Mycobacterium sp. CnD-18-1]MCG7607141.1 helix-turn-helix domain-containing protein [Mycobacterium sp. CnD-18-1]
MRYSAVKAIGEPPDEAYAVIPNDLIDDIRLSPLARMLGIWLRSRPRDWTTNEVAMCRAMKVKDPKTIRKALRELYDTGWAKRVTNESDGRAYQHVYMTLRSGRFKRD